jgi:hypothetical protein
MTLPRALLFFASLSALGCDPSPSPAPLGPSARASLNLDPWVRSSRGVNLAASTSLAPELVIPVADELQAEAQALLAQSASVQLDLETAARFAGEGIELAAQSGVPVLVRSVRAEDDGSGLEKDDRYVVRCQQELVVVSHHGGRRTRTRQERRALVVVLPAAPDELFVECLTAIHDLPGK